MLKQIPSSASWIFYSESERKLDIYLDPIEENQKTNSTIGFPAT